MGKQRKKVAAEKHEHPAIERKELTQEEREKLWNEYYEAFIHLARKHKTEWIDPKNPKAPKKRFDTNRDGRLLIKRCIGFLKGDDEVYSPWPKRPGCIPEPLASYLAEILEAALAADSKDKVSYALHITRPAHRPKSKYSKPRLWCAAWIKAKARKNRAHNLPENGTLAKELVEALSNETQYGTDERTIRRWLEKDVALAVSFLCFEDSDEEQPPHIKNHPLYGI